MNSFMHVVAFNKEMEELIRFIHAKFPDDTSVQQTKAQIEMANQFTPKKACISFMTYAMKFQKQLQNRDDAFFLQQGMQSSELAHLHLDTKWSAFTDQEKEYMWDKITLMNHLGARIIQTS